MTPSVPKPPAPPPPPPSIDTAAQQADANNLIRRRRGYAATVLAGSGSSPQTRAGTAALMGEGGTTLGAGPSM
jgi:hypothetical protein